MIFICKLFPILYLWSLLPKFQIKELDSSPGDNVTNIKIALQSNWKLERRKPQSENIFRRTHTQRPIRNLILICKNECTRRWAEKKPEPWSWTGRGCHWCGGWGSLVLLLQQEAWASKFRRFYEWKLALRASTNLVSAL